ncbi:hypothetical protein FIBSPDRAFT_900276 [Athelia psychrophila]|uniref:Uncharacterized protein n=1 Tax=Athelia psychrophila TaxID=1759441 RepID=A0A165YPC1_9AGAM|nr:hypothetical protein FIBSPDRAFT_900276 [Fibularhizoctonia sp. CBS 109695]
MSSNIADEQFWSELAILLDTPWPGGEPGVILDPGSGSGSLVTIDQPAPPLDGDVELPPWVDQDGLVMVCTPQDGLVRIHFLGEIEQKGLMGHDPSDASYYFAGDGQEVDTLVPIGYCYSSSSMGKRRAVPIYSNYSGPTPDVILEIWAGFAFEEKLVFGPHGYAPFFPIELPLTGLPPVWQTLGFAEDDRFLEHLALQRQGWALADLTGTPVIVATPGATAFAEFAPTPLHTLATLPDDGITEDSMPTVEALAYRQTHSKRKRRRSSDGSFTAKNQKSDDSCPAGLLKLINNAEAGKTIRQFILFEGGHVTATVITEAVIDDLSHFPGAKKHLHAANYTKQNTCYSWAANIYGQTKQLHWDSADTALDQGIVMVQHVSEEMVMMITQLIRWHFGDDLDPNYRVPDAIIVFAKDLLAAFLWDCNREPQAGQKMKRKGITSRRRQNLDPTSDLRNKWLSPSDLTFIHRRHATIKASRDSDPAIDIELQRLVSLAKDFQQPAPRPFAIDRNDQAQQSKRKTAAAQYLGASGSGHTE